MDACSKCNNDGCAWKTYREDLIRYWLECRQRNREFGDLCCVDVANRRARKICYIKYNSFVNLPPDTPAPVCVVNGLSYLFPSEEFQDGTLLLLFLEQGERPCKRERKDN